ncbi:MAG: hypothetical protein DIU65_10000, partial [Proteobacteria bacterium]
MLFHAFNGRFFAAAAIAGFMLAAAGCQSSDLTLGMGGDKQAAKPQEAGKVTASSLRAYCPRVTLREGTAYFNTYGRGGRGRAGGGEGRQ